MDKTRRQILKTGAAATVVAAAPRVFAQSASGGTGSFYERGPVRIHFEEFGSGIPLMLIAGGGLNSTIAGLTNPFDAIGEFKAEYRCIAADLRNANAGQSSGPLEIDRPWDAYTDDHIGLMDHLRIDKFMFPVRWVLPVLGNRSRRQYARRPSVSSIVVPQGSVNVADANVAAFE